jgi:hypothetical protein
MKKFLKYTGIFLLTILVGILLFVTFIYFRSASIASKNRKLIGVEAPTLYTGGFTFRDLNKNGMDL